MNTESDRSADSADSLALWALVISALGVVAVIVAYWLILPAVVLSLVAVIVGVIARGERYLALASETSPRSPSVSAPLPSCSLRLSSCIPAPPRTGAATVP